MTDQQDPTFPPSETTLASTSRTVTPEGSEPDLSRHSLSPSGSARSSIARAPNGTKASAVKTTSNNVASFVDLSQRASPPLSPTMKGWEGFPGLGSTGSGPGSGSGKGSPFTPLKRVKKSVAANDSPLSTRGSVSGDKPEPENPKLVMLHVDLIPPPKDSRHSKHPFSSLSPILFSRGILLQHPHSSFTRLHADIRSSLGLTLPTISTRVLSKTTLPEEEEGVIIVEKKVQVKGWEVNVYAANGLMTGGAWERVWEQMERVDVEVVVGEWTEVRREVRHVGDPEPLDSDDAASDPGALSDTSSSSSSESAYRRGRKRESTPVPYPMTDDSEPEDTPAATSSRPHSHSRHPSIEEVPDESEPLPSRPPSLKPALRRPKPRSPSPPRPLTLKQRLTTSRAYLRTLDIYKTRIAPRLPSLPQTDQRTKLLIGTIVCLVAMQTQMYFSQPKLPVGFYDGGVASDGVYPVVPVVGDCGGTETAFDVLAPTGEPGVVLEEGGPRTVIVKRRRRVRRSGEGEGEGVSVSATVEGEETATQGETEATGEVKEEGEEVEGVDEVVVPVVETEEREEEEEEEDLPKRVLWKIIGE